MTASSFVGVASSATHQVEASGNTIPQQSHTGLAITTDGVPATNGGVDGYGNTLSWTAAGRTFQPAFTGQSPQVLEEGKLFHGENRLHKVVDEPWRGHGEPQCHTQPAKRVTTGCLGGRCCSRQAGL